MESDMINVVQKPRYIKAAVVSGALLRALPLPTYDEREFFGTRRRCAAVEFMQGRWLFVDLETSEIFMTHSPDESEEVTQAAFDFIMAFAVTTFASYGVDHGIAMHEVTNEHYFRIHAYYVNYDEPGNHVHQDITGDGLRDYIKENGKAVAEGIIKSIPVIMELNVNLDDDE
jgi:hypothetical protein